MSDDRQRKEASDQVLAKYIPGNTMEERLQNIAEMKNIDVYQALQLLSDEIVELKHQNRQLSQDACEDPDTKLMNKKTFLKEVNEAIEDLQRRATEEEKKGKSFDEAVNGSGYYIAFVDMNGLKPINDDYGHAAGDQAILEIAERLQNQIRPTDKAARIGGDEFAVLMRIEPSDDIESAKERFENAMNDMRTNIEGVDMRLSASVGFLHVNVSQSAEDQLNAADQKMYAHKKRNHLHRDADTFKPSS